MHLYRLKIQFLDPPRAMGFPEGSYPLNFSHMKNKELRWFKYKRTLFPKCQLRPFLGRFEIQVKKYKRKNRQSNMGLPEKVPKGATRFRTWEMGMGDIYLDCHPGLVDKPVVRGDANGNEARGCGIGNILINLCIFEKKIHNIKFNRKNNALKALKPKFKKEMKWMKSQCKKVVMLEPITYIVPKKVFFISLLKNLKEFLENVAQFGFTIMVIKVPKAPKVPESLYPNAGPCRTRELAANYKSGRMNIDGGNGVVVTGDGNEWFFCVPTKKRGQRGLPKCKK